MDCKYNNRFCELVITGEETEPMSLTKPTNVTFPTSYQLIFNCEGVELYIANCSFRLEVL